MKKRIALQKTANEARIETGEYTITATGMDIKVITQSVVSASAGACFDIKA